MRLLFRTRRGWPIVGLTLAAGLLVGDCLFVVGPYMEQFHVGSLWPLLGGAFGIYALACVGVDLALQWLAPERAARSVWIRMGTILVVATGFVVAAGESRSLPLVAAAGLFALLALGRFTWPVAAVVVAIVLHPLSWSPSPPEVDHAETLAPDAPALARKPSFVVVILDTVRADHTSAYGYERDTTPNLTRLAARGVRFERAYTTACWSLPSHASLFTGLLPSRHGAHNEHLALDGGHPTLAELLAANGYETVNVTANAWIGPGTGMSRGFEHNHESWRSYHVDLMLLAKRVYFALLAPDRDKGGADSIAGIRLWLSERDATRPYLLFLNVFEAHAPYQHVPRAFRRRFTPADISLRELEAIGTRVFTATQNGNLLSADDAATGGDLLDGAIAAADSVLGQVLELVGDDPIMVVASDHGELFGEHTLFGHSNTLYEPLIRIPLLIAGGSLPRGLVVREIVSLTDITPTLLAMAGARAPQVDGTDLSPLFGGGGPLEPRPVRAEQFRPMELAHGWPRNRPTEIDYLYARKQAVVGASLKRIVAADGSDWGYDLATDPGEERPFPGADTGLSAHIPGPQATAADVEFAPFQRKMLEVLGYLH